MALQVYQVDAFTDAAFGGNPASVVLLPPGSRLSDSERFNIAAETKQSMTAFLEPVADVAHQGTAASQQSLFQSADRFRLRWFTPAVEYRLCGHATLASAAALFQGQGNPAQELLFDTVHSGQLSVRRMGREQQPLLQMSLPLHDPTDAVPWGIAPGSDLVQSLTGGTTVAEVAYHQGLRYLLIRLASGGSQQLRAVSPDLTALRAAEQQIQGLMITCAPDEADDAEYDFFSRVWTQGPPSEDAATGSAHAVAGPFWAQRLGKMLLKARQCSARGGELAVEVDRSAGRVHIGGHAVIVFSGQLHLPSQA